MALDSARRTRLRGTRSRRARRARDRRLPCRRRDPRGREHMPPRGQPTHRRGGARRQPHVRVSRLDIRPRHRFLPRGRRGGAPLPGRGAGRPDPDRFRVPRTLTRRWQRSQASGAQDSTECGQAPRAPDPAASAVRRRRSRAPRGVSRRRSGARGYARTRAQGNPGSEYASGCNRCASTSTPSTRRGPGREK